MKEALEGEMRFFPSGAKAAVVLEPSEHHRSFAKRTICVLSCRHPKKLELVRCRHLKAVPAHRGFVHWVRDNISQRVLI